MTYINTKTNSVIESVIENGSTLVEAGNTSWKLITDASEKKESASIELPVTESISESKPYFPLSVKNIDVSMNECGKTYGVVSDLITITNARYIELTANVVQKGGSVEFYVIDGIKEKPIMPIDIERVEDEKLFYGLPTRFDIDTSEPVTIKKDGVAVGTDIDNTLLKDGLYTISYKPINGYRVEPDNTDIRIKLVVRQYNDGPAPFVSNVSVLKHGGTLQWTI